MSKKPINVAIVGLGFGAEFIPIYQRHPDANMYAICQRNEKRLNEIGDAFGISKRYTSYDELLKDKEIEAVHINRQLRRLGIAVVTHHDVTGLARDHVELTCGYGGTTQQIAATAVVLVTARLPNEALYLTLTDKAEEAKAAGIKSVTRIGDCLAPGLIAHAVYHGHRYARELDAPAMGEVPFKRHLPAVTVP